LTEEENSVDSRLRANI